MQIDNLSELGKDKFPPESIIWDGSSEDLDDWIDSVLSRKSIHERSVITLNPSEIEE
jgi:hypothetical protein